MNIRRPKLITAIAGGVIAAMTVIGAASAQSNFGQVAAKVESQTRPNFGALLDPPTRGTRYRPHQRRWNYNQHRHGPGFLPPPPIIGGEEVVLVDCGGNPGSGAVETAVQRVRPGGTLIIRARSGGCVGWLNVDKPMTIMGEGRFDPRDDEFSAPITLQAPDGVPCLTVGRGVRVQVRDIVFASPRGGDAACIVSYGGEVVAQNVGMRHTGDEAAIYADGGLLDLRDMRINADTVAPAVVADGAVLQTDEVYIAGSSSGLEVVPGEGGLTQINRTRIIGPSRQSTFGPRAIGILVRAMRDYGEIAITNSKVCGYPEGIVVEGATVRLDRTRICKADTAISLHGGEISVENSRLVADTYGVAVVAGQATIKNNILADVSRRAWYQENRGVIMAEGNRVWSRTLCPLGYTPVYGNRFAPVWAGGGGQGYSCMSYPYPREWWRRDESALGVTYDPRVSIPDAYEQFRNGYGWYDCRGRFVSSGRYYGEDRWSRGPQGFTRECPRPRNWGGYAGGYRNSPWSDGYSNYDIDFDAGFSYGL